jgi:hypothetical protein
MDIRKLGLGLGAFAAGAAAWAWGASRYGKARGDGLPGEIVPGDSVTAPVLPRPATLAAAPVGQAEAEKGLPAGRPNPAAEHVPTDLLATEPVGRDARAPEDFRPDPTAVPTDAEREALRPATGPAPTLAAERGSGFSEAAGAA